MDELVKGDGEAVIARAIEVAEQRKKHAASGVCLHSPSHELMRS